MTFIPVIDILVYSLPWIVVYKVQTNIDMKDVLLSSLEIKNTIFADDATLSVTETKFR